MAELVLVHLAPWGGSSVDPVLQWGNASAVDGTLRLVRLRGGGEARLRASQVKTVQLPQGTSVLFGPRRERGVVKAYDPVTGSYSVSSIRGVVTGCPPVDVCPDPDPWPLPGALAAPSACAATGVYSKSGAKSRLSMALRRLLTAALADGLDGAAWIDCDLLPHQVGAVQAALASPTIGHLLADEVGLGKTIEALMIWSASLARSPTLRTLIVAPRSLVPQWAFEIQRRATRGLGPWYSALPRVFVSSDERGDSFDAFDAPEPTRPVVAEHGALKGTRIPEGAADLLIVDEGHALTTDERRGVDRLAKFAAQTLILTATPRRSRQLRGAAASRAGGDAATFAWALSVVDPRFGGDAAAAEAATQAANALNGVAAKALLGDAAAVASAADRVNSSRAAERLPNLPTEATRADIVKALARDVGPYERVIRTQRRQVAAGLGRRELHEWSIEYREEELALLRRLGEWFDEAVETGEAGAAGAKHMAASSWAALRAAAPPDIRDALRDVGEADARLDAVLDLLGAIWAEDPKRRVVIRAAYAETRGALKQLLQDLLHDGALRDTTDNQLDTWNEDSIGAVALVQRSQESLVDGLARVGDADAEDPEVDPADTILGNLVAFDEGDAVVLIGDATAEAGLNLQHASDLIFADLPPNPRAAEQWIGRLDRLGRHDGDAVRVHVLTHPLATDANQLELYKVLGVFAKGYQVPPEVADEVDELISKADQNRLRWREAIERARRLVSQIEGEDGDAVLGAVAPDQAVAARAADEALGVGREAVSATLDFFDALRSAGLEVEHGGGAHVSVRWGRSALALRRLSEKMAPRQIAPGMRPDQGGGNRWTLEVPLARRGLDARIRRSGRMMFSPRHPLVQDVAEELALDAGRALSFLSGSCPPPLARASGQSVALMQMRTFPEAQGVCALWKATIPDGRLVQLDRIRDNIARALGRILSRAAPPRAALRGYVLASDGGVARVVGALDDTECAAVFESMARARPGTPPAWTAAALRALEATISHPAPLGPSPELRESFLQLAAFVSRRRRQLSLEADRTITEKAAVVRTTDGRNPGFVAQLGVARRDRQAIDAFFDALEPALLNVGALLTGARTEIATEVVFFKLEASA